MVVSPGDEQEAFHPRSEELGPGTENRRRDKRESSFPVTITAATTLTSPPTPLPDQSTEAVPGRRGHNSIPHSGRSAVAPHPRPPGRSRHASAYPLDVSPVAMSAVTAWECEWGGSPCVCAFAVMIALLCACYRCKLTVFDTRQWCMS